MIKRTFLLLMLFLLVCTSGWAHIIPYELDKKEGGETVIKYLLLGYRHIIPLGLDHILFILCVFFLNSRIKQVILQASMFTLAHSVTLGLAAAGVIHPSSQVVEPLIALSIVFLAVENIFRKEAGPWRMAMIFLFGLVHGMGFAGALAEAGLPEKDLVKGLISFNAGVELGQISIILVMYILVARPFGDKGWYRRSIVLPASVVIGAIAGILTVQRMI